MGVAELKTQRGVAKCQLTKMRNYVDAKGKTATQFELQTKLEMLETYMNNFNNVQTKIEEEETEIEFKSGERDVFEDGYFVIKAKILSLLAERRSSVTQSTSTNLNSTSSHQSNPIHNLPKLNVPTFDGQITKWLEFWISFKSLIHDNSEIHPSDKLQYLKQSLKGGKAETILQALDPREENYDNAIKLVKSRFYKKRFLFQSHINGLFDLPSITRNNIDQLHQMIDKVNAHMTSMKSIAKTEQILDGLLIHILSSKLDHSTQLFWEEEVTKQVSSKSDSNQSDNELNYPTWSEFCEFIERTCDTHEILLFNKSGSSKNYSSFQSKRSVSLLMNEHACQLCGESHFLFNCSKFSKLSQQDRFKEVKRLALCMNCLKTNKHLQANCPSKGCCKYCTKPTRHHSMLHIFSSSQRESSAKYLQPTASVFVPSSQQVTSNSSNCNISTEVHSTSLTSTMDFEEEALLSTAVVHAYCSNGENIPCRILLDTGSQTIFVTESFSNLLRAPLKRVDKIIGGIGNSTTRTKFMAIIKIGSRFRQAEITLDALVIKNITGLQPQRYFAKAQFNIPLNIELADQGFNVPQKIDLLLGNKYVFQLLSVGQISLGPLVLQKSLFGWIAAGSYFTSNQSITTLHSIDVNKDHDDELSQNTISKILGSFYLAEDLPSTSYKLSKEESDCERHFLSTHNRSISGRYIVKLPFRCHLTIGESYDIALRRFNSLEKKFLRDEELYKSYKDFMNEYLFLGHMESITTSEWTNKPHFFLPHHPVIKEESSTTKLRVVFDGSSKTLNGHSLNDCLMVGPTMQPDLFSILIRFRFHRYVLAADITKMYRQVDMHPSDQLYQLILWRKSPGEEIQVMKLKTITYGTSSASYLAIRCMIHLAETEAKSNPIGSQVILNDFYVDNMLTGADSIDELKDIKTNVIQVLEKGGFPLRKWMSNEDQLLDDILLQDREKFMMINNEDMVKTLGLAWIPSQDNFIFYQKSSQVSTTKYQQSFTKRYVLSKIGSFFDPLGILAPLVVAAKLFMRHLWILKLNWDESLPLNLQTEWETYEHQLNSSQPIIIPRHVIPQNNNNLELHGFCDASTQAYGACIYVKSGGIIRLLCAKSKVASVKSTTTIPRLELCSAVLLSELMEKVKGIIQFDRVKFYCWSDSTIVLSWIHTSSILTHTFVANRIEKIQLLSKEFNWRHVPGELNPADLASRGALPDHLLSTRWFNGPQFLEEDEVKWPTSPLLLPSHELPNYKDLKFSFASQEIFDIISSSKFANSYKKIVAVFCYIRRFTRMSSSRGRLTNDEFYEAELMIARYLQRLTFPQEYDALLKGQRIPIKSSLVSLSPFLDNSSTMRVGGRLKHAPISFDAKHQVLLPSGHCYSKALLNYLHREHMHCGPQALLYCLRQRYWIPSGKRMCTTIFHRCILCFKSRPNFIKQLMAHLPKDRVSQCFPFAVCGVDFCGPFTVKFGIRNRNRAKMYIALFICFVTKAVHLEIVSNLSTDAFLSTLQQFISRRGKPLRIYSDNATNFIGTNNRLKDLNFEFTKQEHQEKVIKYCQPDIEWSFIPARSPHFGGLWESGVKIAKIHLNKKIANYTPTENELRTLVYQVEAIINSRPISPMSSDANDIIPLTPGHFLVGRQLTSFNTPSVIHLNSNSLNSYHQQQHIIQSYWKSFHKDYLNNLQTRNNNRFPNRNLKVNDLVILVDDNSPTFKWKSGIITRTFPGDDNLVRTVEVKSNGTLFRRAAARVCLLPLDAEANVESLGLQGGRYVGNST